MFAKKQRLSRLAIASAVKNSRRIASEHLTLLFPKGVGGYAVIIPKKTIRLANKRNYARRRVLHALRDLSLPPALIIFPKASVTSVKYKDLVRELTETLSKQAH